MKFIFGLGNPGTRYEQTRHNIGFSFLDYLRNTWEFPSFRKDSRLHVLISSGRIGVNNVFLAKPLTFMNNSGQAVHEALNFYKEDPKNISVVHDDLDIQSGKMKLSENSRSAGHNGVQSIIDHIGTQEFLRIRIGVGNSFPQNDHSEQHADSSSFVLGNMSSDELSAVESTFPKAEAILREWIRLSSS